MISGNQQRQHEIEQWRKDLEDNEKELFDRLVANGWKPKDAAAEARQALDDAAEEDGTGYER